LDAFQCEAVDPADVTAIATSVKRALAAYGTPALKEMIQNGMAQDLSWKVSMISALIRKLVPLEKFTRILSRKIQLHLAKALQRIDLFNVNVFLWFIGLTDNVHWFESFDSGTSQTMGKDAVEPEC
jgi:hypothetical protein